MVQAGGGRDRRRRVPAAATWALGLGALALAVPALAASVDRAALATAWRSLLATPGSLLLALCAFAAAFLLRAALWRRLVPQLPLGQAWAAIHVSLAMNHVLPLRLGEGARVVSAVRRTGVGLGAATASSVALRAADVVTVAVIAAALAPTAAVRLLGWWGIAVVGVVAVAGVVAARSLGRLASVPGGDAIRRLDPVSVAGSAGAWLLEAVVVWQAAAWVGIDLTPPEALLVTAVSVVAQVAAVAPGGIGTYEAASVAAYATIGVDPGTALAAAVVAHAVKTAYSLVVGGIALLLPSPGFLGRLRLLPPARRPVPAAAEAATPALGAAAPVVLFLPARDEAPRVAKVVARAPRSVRGHPVEVVVVDDGSTDGTAEVAAAAGADVVAIGGLGLGAGVRRGLAEGVARGAVAVAFCDADEEYDPAELERLVGPILDGGADYVVGSRFDGDIERMLPHRRAGNLVLTRLLTFVSRTRISDGQSGYRALSPQAAAAAEVIHDFNYAQVLTLDLLAKGFRYHEVPISYRFRTSGRSFVRLGRYLRRVVPAVWREVNGPAVAVRDVARAA